MKPKAKDLYKARHLMQNAEPLLAMPELPGQVKGAELARLQLSLYTAKLSRINLVCPNWLQIKQPVFL